MENEVRIGFIGDIHGRDCWKEFVKDASIDKWVFVGDYCDSKDLTDYDIYSNLSEIIAFKQENQERVILLLGNHDLPYLYEDFDDYACSGFRFDMWEELNCLFTVNRALFDYAFQYGELLCTHAGVDQVWFTESFKGSLSENIANQLNHPKSKKQTNALHQVGKARRGRHNTGGIFWCDKSELNHPLFGLRQIIGHTKVNEVEYHLFLAERAELIYIDCLTKKSDFLTLEIPNPENTITIHSTDELMRKTKIRQR